MQIVIAYVTNLESVGFFCLFFTFQNHTSSCKKRYAVTHFFFVANPDDEEQGVFFNEIKRANYGRIPDDKINFSKTIRFIFNGRLSNKIMSEKEIMRQKKLLKKYTAI